MRSVRWVGVVAMVSCASPAETNCAANVASATSTKLVEVRTDSEGKRTVRSPEGVQVSTSSGGDLEVTEPDGKKVVVAPDGSVSSSERDVVVVRSDGTRQVWDHTTRTLVSEETWKSERSGTTTTTGAASTKAMSVTTPASAAPVSAAPESEKEDDGGAKVTICHVPPGNPANQHTLSVGASAVAAHLGHGDYEGECDPAHAGTKEHGKGAENGKGSGGGKGKKK